MERAQPRIPTELIASPSNAPTQKLVVVLPGIGDDLQVMREGGIVPAIHAGMPDADVLLVELKYPYYRGGRAAPRLHNEIVLPARQRGYREITLVGASLGGMGVLLYEHRYPGEVQNLVLMAPYMGSRSVLEEIHSAGGLSLWDPGNLPEAPEVLAAARIEWHLVKSWLRDRNRAADVWLVCGEDDRFIEAARTIEPVLSERNFVQPIGGHEWKVWSAGAQAVFERIGSDQLNASLAEHHGKGAIPKGLHGDSRPSARVDARNGAARQ